MTKHSCLLVPLTLSLAACGSTTVAPPDAPSTIPRAAVGTFALTSELDLGAPVAGADALAALVAGAADPMGFVVGKIVDELPVGTIQNVAREAAPLLAAYLDVELAAVAPRFTSGVHALGEGLARIAQHAGTHEQLAIGSDGSAVRTITALVFDAAVPVTATLSDHGIGEIGAATRVTIDRTGRVAIAQHELALPYGSWLRLGLDTAAVPTAVPGATDLASALTTLVGCDAVGAAIATKLGLGSPAIYELACATALTAAATDVYDHLAALDAPSLVLVLAGAADGLDLDGDGLADQLVAGTWSGTVTRGTAPQAMGPATFSAARQ
jgi:hypothetical protein